MSAVIPTPEELARLLRYNPETGRLYWRHARQRVARGARAGYTNGSGYRGIKIMQRQFMEHRVAWAIFYGAWPADDVDHINRDRSDNRIANLRVVDRTENNLNREGVGCRINKGKWEAYVHRKGKRKYLGRFDTEAEARHARALACPLPSALE